ncbi:MAG: hypothetical protein JWR69_465 [Pedosphaera sp.]|nr:hypothetical protein [Pedosphaera sp.]
MFNTFKRFFGKRVEDKVDSPPEVRPAAPPQRPAAPPPARRVDAEPRVAVGESQPRPAGTSAATLSLPLRSVLARLPADLATRVRQTDVGEAEVFVPMQKVISQLAQGAVRVSFGELRQSSPPGTFSPENDRDRVLVDLPLNEILTRVNPGLLARRPVQKHVDVPQEVTGPFGGQTQVTISSVPLKPVAKPRSQPVPEEVVFKQTNAAAAQPNPPVYAPMVPSSALPLKPAVLPETPVFARVNPPSVPPVTPPGSQESLFQRAPMLSAAPPPVQPARDEPTFKRMNLVPPVHTPIAPAPEPEPLPIPFGQPGTIPAPASSSRNLSPPPLSAPAPVALPAPPAEPELIRFNPSFAPAPVSAPAPTPVPPPPAASRETVFLTVSLLELSQDWPESVRQEITTLSLSTASIALPQGVTEAAIKQGKVAFPWKLIRSWIKPLVDPSHVSPHDAVVLELPLKVITPAFMASLRANRPQKKVSIDANIPNLFSGTAGAEPVAVSPTVAAPLPVAPATAFAPVAPATASGDTNYYVWKDKDEPPVEEKVVIKKGPSPGTSFLQRYATPNEIVSKASGLDGVGGALIALPDGLLVASKIPADMNADTLAAFLPQIFGRVSQSTRELRMGDLNNLNFTVGLIPWKIFRVGAIYFAAFGIAGQPLPTARLAGIAAELDRKAK